MTTKHEQAVRLVGTLLCALGVGWAVGLLVASQVAAARPAASSIFPSESLMPGETLSGQFVVPSREHAFVPWIRVRDLRETCGGSRPCPASQPSLSADLQLVLTAPEGTTRQTTLASLVKPASLPGGQMLPGSGARRYDATLTLPARIGNSVQDRNLSFDLQYGAGTNVLGETFHRGGPPVSANQGGVLPFTGADIVVEVAAALSLLAIGVMLLLAGRRRFRPDRS